MMGFETLTVFLRKGADFFNGELCYDTKPIMRCIYNQIRTSEDPFTSPDNVTNHIRATKTLEDLEKTKLLSS